MATSTASLSNVSSSSQVARSRPCQSLLWRIFAALSDARMRQAQREIARHSHLFGGKPARHQDDGLYFGL